MYSESHERRDQSLENISVEDWRHKRKTSFKDNNDCATESIIIIVIMAHICVGRGGDKYDRISFAQSLAKYE